MKFGELFVDSLIYPLTDLKRLLILLVLFVGSFLIVPGLIGYGYVLRIIKHSLKGEKGLPNFDNKWELFSKGIDFFVASLVYGIPALLVVFLLFHQLNFNSISGDLIFSSPINMLIYILVNFLVSIVFVIALTNMVYENRLFAAFDLKRIFHLIRMIGLKKYLSYIIVYTLIVDIISLLSLIALYPHISSIGSLFIILTVISYILSTYKIVFGSRFKALIFPLELKET
jgi:hypothetical protein